MPDPGDFIPNAIRNWIDELGGGGASGRWNVVFADESLEPAIGDLVIILGPDVDVTPPTGQSGDEYAVASEGPWLRDSLDMAPGFYRFVWIGEAWVTDRGLFSSEPFELPATPSEQDIADVLVALGLATQAE